MKMMRQLGSFIRPKMISPTINIADDRFAVQAVLDGNNFDIAFSAAQAHRKAERWLTSGNDIHFAFATGTSGYLVEYGNLVNFRKPQLAHAVSLKGMERVSVEVRLAAHDLSKASLGVFCFLCNDAGDVILKTKIAIEHGYGRDVVRLPPGVAHICFAVRMEGTGYFSALSLKIDRTALNDLTPPPEEVPALPVADQMTSCVRRRDYRMGIKLADSLGVPGPRETKMLIRCYASLHDFEQVIRVFESMPLAAQAEPGLRLYYLRALGNTGQTSKAHAFIAAACLDLRHDHKITDFLLMAYPFAVHLSAELARMVLARIVTSSARFRKNNLNHLLRCAHDLISALRYEDFYTIVNALLALDLGADDAAKLDILSAQAAYMTGHPEALLAGINRAMAVHGAATLRATPSLSPLCFKDLYSPECTPYTVHGPLVSVLMTSYNSAATIEYALQSLMAQTYADLEIIVIDDASTDDTCAIIRSLAGQDARIRLIALDRNGGTYVAKNHGLKAAQGVYVTCQDSDDWAHPQKMERLSATLQDHPALMATAVQHIRFDPQRGFRGLGGYIRFDASSMMYRRKVVVDAIGYYDSVRVGGDSEFQFRLERVFGRSAFRQMPDLLSLVLWSETSLSGGGQFAIDDDAGIFTPFRNIYRQAFCSWQETAQDLYMPFPLTTRRFDVPPEGLP